MDIEKILKSAEFVFEDKTAKQAIDFIRVLVDKFLDQQQSPAQNALVQIHAPGTVMINEDDLKKLQQKAELVGALQNNIFQLENHVRQLEQDSEDMSVEYEQVHSSNRMLFNENKEMKSELEHLRKSRGMCQLDSTGTCTFCEKRVILATNLMGK